MVGRFGRVTTQPAPASCVAKMQSVTVVLAQLNKWKGRVECVNGSLTGIAFFNIFLFGVV